MPATALPDFALVLPIGPPDPARDALLARHFTPNERVDPHDAAGAAARLAARRLVVASGANLRPAERAPWLRLAKRFHAPAVGLAFAPPPGGSPRAALHAQRELEDALRRAAREGLRTTHRIDDGAVLRREPLDCDRRAVAGPFDIVGDVHGCRGALDALLARLGYDVDGDGATPPQGRRAVFVGDLVDRGPDGPGVVRLVRAMVEAGSALCTLGNHDRKLARALAGRGEGDRATMAQLARRPEAERDAARRFLDALPSHLWLDGGRLVVVHAAIRPEMIGRQSKALEGYALHGPTTGRLDASGHPERLDWAAGYDGGPSVVHGHVPARTPRWRGRVIGVDTGCGMGGPLTALRWPEGGLASVAVREA